MPNECTIYKIKSILKLLLAYVLGGQYVELIASYGEDLAYWQDDFHHRTLSITEQLFVTNSTGYMPRNLSPKQHSQINIQKALTVRKQKYCTKNN